MCIEIQDRDSFCNFWEVENCSGLTYLKAKGQGCSPSAQVGKMALQPTTFIVASFSKIFMKYGHD